MTGGAGNEELLSLLDDDYARAIIVETRDGPRSAEELSDAIDASPSTVYRRIERLREHDLVEGEQSLDPDGHHHEVYIARLERVTIEVTADGFDVEIDRTAAADPADRFTHLYRELSDE